jgi:hypothetical protein
MKSHPKRFLEVTGKEIPIENKISLGYNNQDCKLPGYFRQKQAGNSFSNQYIMQTLKYLFEP